MGGGPSKADIERQNLIKRLQNERQQRQYQAKIIKQRIQAKSTQLDKLNFQKKRIQSTINKKSKQRNKIIETNHLTVSNINPENFEENTKQLNTNVVKTLVNVKQTLTPPQGVIYYMVAGTQGCGKSYLLNHLIDTHLLVGGDQEGKAQATNVKNIQNKIHVWEVAGSTQNYKFLKDSVKFYKCATKIFLVYDGSIKQHEFMITLIANLSKNIPLILIRTKCDLFNNNKQKLNRTLKEELEVDRRKLADWGIFVDRIYRTSAELELNELDNQEVKKMIQTYDTGK